MSNVYLGRFSDRSQTYAEKNAGWLHTDFFIHFLGQVCFFLVPGCRFFCFSAVLLLCFSASLLLCFSAFCFSCFSAFLLFAFPASLLYLLLFFSASLLSLLPCFSAFVLVCFSTSPILLFLFFSHVLLLLYFLLLCFSAFCLYYFFSFSFALFSPVCILNETPKTLGETQRNPKKILIITPDKKPLHETLNDP